MQTYSKKRRTPRQAYRHLLRLKRALNDRTLPVDAFMRTYEHDRPYVDAAEHYALQRWLQRVNYKTPTF